MSTAHRHLVSVSTKFRAAIAESQPLQVMGAIIAYAAKMTERTDFRAVYLSDGGVTADSLDIPDLSISTIGDVLIDTHHVTDAVQIPLMVGINTGWDGAFNITHTIHSFIKADVAVVHLEDQVGQKHCGHHPGEEVVSTDKMVDRVKAAVDARTNDDSIVMARTDATTSEGIDAAIERAIACVEADADMILPEATKTLDDYRRFRVAVKAPTLVNLTEFGNTPPFTTDELRSANVDTTLYCCGAYRATNAATLNFYQAVMRDDTQKAAVEIMQSCTGLYQYLSYHVYEDKLDTLFAAQKQRLRIQTNSMHPRRLHHEWSR